MFGGVGFLAGALSSSKTITQKTKIVKQIFRLYVNDLDNPVIELSFPCGDDAIKQKEDEKLIQHWVGIYKAVIHGA